MKRLTLLSATALLLLPSAQSLAQQVVDFGTSNVVSFTEGWRGFLDLAFMLSALATLTLSAVLGAIIGYHPRSMALADTLAELEAPKVHITCSVVGAIIGILVVKYGLVVGFVIFGIGGLMRFRTILDSAKLTGNVIFVTLIGLSAGLNLPHVAVLATVFSFVLTCVLDAKTTYTMTIRGIDSSDMLRAAAAYRAVFESNHCQVVSEKKKLNKETLTFVVRAGSDVSRTLLEEKMHAGIDPTLQGAIDWNME